jgi:hypothetical protein
MLLATVAIVSWSLALPSTTDAQNTCLAGSQGQNAVYNATCNNNNPGVVGSPAFIDASKFLGGAQGRDLCDTIFGIMGNQYGNSYPASGAVIDARGVSGSALTCTHGSPWTEGSDTVPVPSTILLPEPTSYLFWGSPRQQPTAL